MEKILHPIKKILPENIFSFFQPIYHFMISVLGAIIYRFPSRKIRVIGVTGTKGKSTTTEIISAILEEAGYVIAVSNTIRFKVANKNAPNMYKMSMPGRFFIQKFIRQAVDRDCDFVVLEMTSQGVLQYRHKFIDLDAFVFTNLSPEHIEAHGSYEKYRDAKLEIAKQLYRSSKRPRIIVANEDDVESGKFLDFDVEIKKTFKLSDFHYNTSLPGEFNKYNILAAATLCKELGIEDQIISKAISNFKEVRGRVEKIDEGQKFTVIVDYAHTADSMKKLYETFPNSRKICVFGATGGGRDKWKRPEMGKIADTYCDEIILTNDDPYDEDPKSIIDEVETGIKNKQVKKIIDRREAIREALRGAKENEVVLITGKGTDPYLMGPNGSKIPWDDAQITREELKKINQS